MSTLAIILTAATVVSGDGPEKVAGEIKKEARLCLVGRWEGTWERRGETSKLKLDENGELKRYYFFDGLVDSFKAEDVGANKLRIKWTGNMLRPSGDYLGVYRREGGNVIICLRPADKGYPTSFKASLETEWLFILHPVKSRK